MPDRTTGGPGHLDVVAGPASRIAQAVPGAAEVVVALIGAPAVQARWTDESTCPGMSVGGLAHHLADQVRLVVRLLAAAATDAEPISLMEHYRRAAWANTDLESEANVGIRRAAEEQAQPGHDALVARLRVDLAALEPALERRSSPGSGTRLRCTYRGRAGRSRSRTS